MREVRPGLRVAFTSRPAGNLALHVGGDAEGVRRRRSRLEESMGIPAGSLRFMSQTHSDRVTVLGDGRGADAAVAGAPDADGMISPTGTDPLAVLVADCVPVVLADESVADGGTGATAVVHAGRAGVANGIVERAVDLLRRRGARRLSAWIGPSVCGSCYEVPEDMMRELALALPETAARTRTGTPALDLPAGVRRQLGRTAVQVESVPEAEAWCTVENTALYSHRREPGAGRLAGLVWRT
ncbi:laccase domain-containing protein [Arthrobacter echini]|uniref:Laccase domain-containing protein n=2 Tax=Arthrobacter echini TaxID=1529066 RepID=A0A4S5E7P4_9MICC|nr:laccase domain-containing protein [Arthrobacter echini]